MTEKKSYKKSQINTQEIFAKRAEIENNRKLQQNYENAKKDLYKYLQEVMSPNITNILLNVDIEKTANEIDFQSDDAKNFIDKLNELKSFTPKDSSDVKKFDKELLRDLIDKDLTEAKYYNFSVTSTLSMEYKEYGIIMENFKSALHLDDFAKATRKIDQIAKQITAPEFYSQLETILPKSTNQAKYEYMKYAIKAVENFQNSYGYFVSLDSRSDYDKKDNSYTGDQRNLYEKITEGDLKSAFITSFNNMLDTAFDISNYFSSKKEKSQELNNLDTNSGQTEAESTSLSASKDNKKLLNNAISLNDEKFIRVVNKNFQDEISDTIAIAKSYCFGYTANIQKVEQQKCSVSKDDSVCEGYSKKVANAIKNCGYIFDMETVADKIINEVMQNSMSNLVVVQDDGTIIHMIAGENVATTEISTKNYYHRDMIATTYNNPSGEAILSSGFLANTDESEMLLTGQNQTNAVLSIAAA